MLIILFECLLRALKVQMNVQYLPFINFFLSYGIFVYGIKENQQDLLTILNDEADSGLTFALGKVRLSARFV